MSEKKLVVFAGPPCSGKSELARQLSLELGIPHLEMDAIRSRILPDSVHSRCDRRVAYRAMHYSAEIAIAQGNDVIVDATYFPRSMRRDLEQVATRCAAKLFLIQCQVDGEVARARFEFERSDEHPAADLTPIRVEMLASKYPYFHGGMLLNTSADQGECLRMILDHIATGSPIELDGSWSQSIPSTQSTPDQVRHSGERLTRSEHALACIRLRFLKAAWWWVGLVLGALLVSFAARLLLLSSWTWPQVAFGWLKAASWPDMLLWGTLALPLAVIPAVWASGSGFLREQKERIRAKATSGDIARYAPFSNPRPQDLFLYEDYRFRAASQDRDDGSRWLEGVPIFYIIPPERRFNVRTVKGGEPFAASDVAMEAALLGLDWDGFNQWRIEQHRAETGRFYNDVGMRCTRITGQGDEYTLHVSRCSYGDYVATDLSVNIEGEDRIPVMRRVLEGHCWDVGGIRLSDVEDSARRFSMLIATSTLAVTSDGYLILQRRSRRISEGAGGVAPSGSGFSRWEDVVPYFRHRVVHDAGILFPSVLHVLPTIGFQKSGLIQAAVRELTEEIGVGCDDVIVPDRPFVGAAYNLLHGRDLNFYMVVKLRRTLRDVSRMARTAVDRWEVAHLIPVPLDDIGEDGSLRGALGRCSPACNRHLRGSLHALARSGFLRELRADE